MKKRERKREVGGSERHYGWGGGTEFIIGFEGSQALLVCPSGKCKLLTGTIEVYFIYLFIFVGVGGVNGLRSAKILKLPLGGLHVKHTEQRGIWVPTQHLVWDQGKPYIYIYIYICFM
jgi:hypothetical protein